MNKSELVLLHRLDSEPVVILGLTRREVIVVLAIALGFWLPVMQMIMGLLGKWAMGVPLGLAASVGSIVIVGVSLARIKRRRPRGYYQLRLRIALEDVGLASSGLIRRGGWWDCRRHRRGDLR